MRPIKVSIVVHPQNDFSYASELTKQDFTITGSDLTFCLVSPGHRKSLVDYQKIFTTVEGEVASWYIQEELFRKIDDLILTRYGAIKKPKIVLFSFSGGEFFGCVRGAYASILRAFYDTILSGDKAPKWLPAFSFPFGKLWHYSEEDGAVSLSKVYKQFPSHPYYPQLLLYFTPRVKVSLNRKRMTILLSMAKNSTLRVAGKRIAEQECWSAWLRKHKYPKSASHKTWSAFCSRALCAGLVKC